jgi:GT2 family glycosyltransferase
MNISIVIPSFNGLSLLQKHLGSVVRHAHQAEIIVIDDASTDASVSWINTKFPRVKVVSNPQNLGFAGSVNRGFNLASNDLVLLLNNDVSINRHTLSYLLPHFQNPAVFGVGALELLPLGKKRGKSVGTFAKGLLIHSPAPSLSFGPTLWLFNASAMFRKRLWRRLGGLDPLYKPAYWEDIDISYRAWKAGYQCLFEPRATVNHDSEATMNQVLGNSKDVYVFKNQLLFYWKNVTDFDLIVSHLLWLPYHLTVTTLKSRGRFLLGFLLALRELGRISSQTSHLPFTISDKTLVGLAH